MTEEELKLEAIKYLENFKDCANCKNRWGDCADQLDEYCLVNGCCFATPKEQNIYLAGAKPREKRIAELEKEIEELKKTYRKQRNKRIDDLQKKNAEMKKQLEMSNKVYNDNLDYSHHIEEQLTKAKTYLKYFIEILKKLGVDKEPLVIEAEQFLKDSEVEK